MKLAGPTDSLPRLAEGSFSPTSCLFSRSHDGPGAVDFSLTTYYPLFIYLVAVIGFAVSAVVAAHVMGPKKLTPVKQMPYESGMDPIGNARQRFDVRFYLVAILFLVFDVELLFLYPWSATYQEGSLLPDVMGMVGHPLREVVFWEALAFLASVVVAYVYAWRKGVFKWR